MADPKPSYKDLEYIIQALKLENKALRETEERFKLLYERAPLAYQSLDKEGCLVAVNQGWLDMFGYDSVEVLGRSIAEFLTPEYQKLFQEYFPRFKAEGEIIGRDFEMVKKDGDHIHVTVDGKIGHDQNGRFLQTHCVLQNVTDQRLHEEQVRRSERRFREVLAHSRDIVFKRNIAQGTYEFMSRSVVDLLGYTEEETLAMGYAGVEMLFHPDDLPRYREFIRKLLDSDSDDSVDSVIEYRMRTKDGDYRWFSDSHALIRDEAGEAVFIIGTNRDVTAQKEAELALKEANDRFLTVLESIDSHIYVADFETHEILYMNRNMKEAFGHDFTGETCWDVFRNEDGPCGHCTNDKLRDEYGNPAGVYVWEGKNPVTGRWYINHDRAIPWEDGRVVRLQIATDITRLKKLEEERKQAEDQLRQRAKMEAVGTLAGGIAHDFNNILSIIIGNAELAGDGIPKWNPSHVYLEEIRSAGIRARDVVRQLLSFSRKTDQEQIPVHPSQLIRQSLKLVRSSIPTTIDMQTHLPDDCETILADPTQIHQVLLNLCSNAAYAMRNREGILEIRLDRVDATSSTTVAEESGPWVRLSVKDNGAGMPPETCNRIFEPYFTTKPLGEGTGMGLAVVHGIVQDHSGIIHVKSKIDVGTEFEVLFPIINAAPDEEHLPGGQVPVGNEKILFIDDEQSIILVGSQMLRHLGYQVDAFTDPKKGLEAFLNHPDSYNLVMTDMTMPGLTGDKLAEHIIGLRPNVPVILCTGYTEQISEEEVRQIGIRQFLIKPLELRELAEAVRSTLDER